MKRKLLAMAVVFTMILSQFTMLPLAADGDGTSPEVYFKSEGLVDTITLGNELSIYPDEYAYTEDEDGDEVFLDITGIKITEGDATVSMEKDEDDYDYYSIKPSKSGAITADFELCYPDYPDSTFHAQNTYLAVYSDMSIDPDRGFVLSGQDLNISSHIEDEEDLVDPEFEWDYEEDCVTGSSLTPSSDGRSATISAGTIVGDDDPFIAVSLTVYSNGELYAFASDYIDVRDEVYDIVAEGYDPDKPLRINESVTLTCSLYKYNKDNPDGELISDAEFSIADYDTDTCTVEQNRNKFTVTKIGEGDVTGDIDANLPDDTDPVASIRFEFPQRDYELYFDDYEDSEFYSDGDMTLTLDTSGLYELEDKCDYKYDVKVIEGYDEESDDEILSDLPDPNKEYFTANGTSITLHGAALWGAVKGNEEHRVYVTAEALYNGEHIDDAYAKVNINEAYFSTGLEYLEDEGFMVNVPYYFEKYRTGQMNNSEYPEGEDWDYTVNKIEISSGPAKATENKEAEEWCIKASAKGKIGIRMEYVVDGEETTRTADFTVEAVEDQYLLDFKDSSIGYEVLPGDTIDLAVNADHVNYKDPDKSLDDYSIKWSVEGTGAEYVTINADGKTAKAVVDSNIPDSVFEEDDLECRFTAQMMIDGKVATECSEEYSITNYMTSIDLDYEDKVVPVNGSVTIDPSYKLRTYKAGVSKDEEINAGYTFDFDPDQVKITDGNGNKVQNKEITTPYNGPFTIKRLSGEQCEIQLYAWNRDGDMEDWSKYKNIYLDELIDISNADFDDISEKTYNGKAKKPVPKLYYEGEALTLNEDFTVSYKNNKNAGKASCIVKGTGYFYGTMTVNFTIKKAKNPMTVKAKTGTVKFKSLKNKNQTLKVSKVLTIKKKQGTLTYTKKSGNKKITINKKNGKVTVKKGLKKGTYKIKVVVASKGNKNYKAIKKKPVTFKVTVK